MAANTKTPPWVWVGLGCLGAVVLAAAVIVGLGVAGWRWARGFEEQMNDPEAREARVLEVLGAERVPDGYHAVAAMEVPFLMEMAMLSDEPVAVESEDGGEIDLEAEDLGERGLVYFEMPSWGGAWQDLDDFLEGRTDEAEFIRRGSVDLHRGEVLARGEITLPGAERARFGAQRGAVGGGGEGLVSTVSIECPGDDRLRLAIWFGPRPDRPPAAGAEAGPEALAGAGRVAGTVADPEEMTAFLGQFRFCD